MVKEVRAAGSITASYGHVGSMLVRLPSAAAQRIARMPGVAYLSPNEAVQGQALDRGYESVGGPAARSFGFTGKDIGVAVIDSGIFDHPDLTGSGFGNTRVVYTQDFTGGDGKDHFGHGTHVAGIIAGNGKDSTGDGYTHTFRGLAPDVKLLNLRVLNDQGAGTESAVVAAIDRAIALKATYNVRIINLSLGRPVSKSYTVDPLCQAVERAWNAGIVVVVSAGNLGRDNTFGTRGYRTVTSPGNHPRVITVGAMNTKNTKTLSDDTVTSYSSKGPTAVDFVAKPDLVAPGNQAIALLASNTTISNTYSANRVPFSLYYPSSSSVSDKYYRLSGTSMAAPWSLVP